MIFTGYKKKRQIEKYRHLLNGLIETDYQKMFRITMNYVHDKEEALDVMQDSFHKALKYFEKEKEIEHFNAWFYRILIRTALDSWRRQKRTPVDLFEIQDIPQQLPLETSVAELHMILDKIDSPEKEILILYFFEGFRLKEIATILDMNENTVKTKMYRLLNVLRQILE